MDCIIWEMLDPWRRILLASTERRSALLFRAVVAFLELASGLALARARARTALVFRIGTFPSIYSRKVQVGRAVTVLVIAIAHPNLNGPISLCRMKGVAI